MNSVVINGPRHDGSQRTPHQRHGESTPAFWRLLLQSVSVGKSLVAGGALGVALIGALTILSGATSLNILTGISGHHLDDIAIIGAVIVGILRTIDIIKSL